MVVISIDWNLLPASLYMEVFMKQELETREYCVDEIKQDDRFIRCYREMLIVQGIIFAAIFLCLTICYTMSTNSQGNAFVYLWGYPAWYVYATAVMVATSIVSIVYSCFFIKTDSLDARI